MKRHSKDEYKPGPRIIRSIPCGTDLIRFLRTVCREKGIETASFWIMGSVSSATIGVYDPKQQVWVTHIEKEATEIISCRGHLSQTHDFCGVTAKIILANQLGQLTGGHLFSDTPAFHAQIDIQALAGEPSKKKDDASRCHERIEFNPTKEDMMQLTITQTQTLKPKPDDARLGFGTIFTDHMFVMDYSDESGWHRPRIEPYHSFQMDPATMVLHYGQAVFEGLKAYRTADGAIQLFRPQDNFKRLNRSSKLLCIPAVDEAFALTALKQLLSIEKDWVPRAQGTSLYVRPTIIATDPFLGVRASFTYRFFIILSPVGAYYAEGFNPVKILVTKDHVRAVRGGVGEAKTPGNYAASLLAGNKAHDEGYTQVLWLDGVTQEYVEEVGSMNIFFVINNEIVTPELSGSILPGITRDSVIRLANSWGIPVTERKISIKEVLSAHASGALMEIFGSGTAAVISPVGELKYGDTVITIGDGGVGPISDRLFNVIQDIQYGRTEDSMGWIEPVC